MLAPTVPLMAVTSRHKKIMIDDTKRLFWMLMVHLIRLTTGANSIVHEYMHESIYRIHEQEHKA